MKQREFAERKTPADEIGVVLAHHIVEALDMSSITGGFPIGILALRWQNFGVDIKVIGKKYGLVTIAFR